MTFKHFVIYLDIYDFYVHFCIGDKDKTLKHVNKLLQLPDIQNNLAAFDLNHMDKKGLRFRREGYIPVVWLPRVPKTTEELGTLSHEIFHVTCDVCRHVSIPLTEYSEEAYCYITGYLTKQFWEKIK
jgi:hypothetical protein